MKKWLKWLVIGFGLLIVVSVVYVAVYDAGTISVQYAPSNNPDHERIRQSLVEWRGFETLAAELDTVFLMPRDLPVWFTDCGQVNAYYDPEQTQVLLCYELVADLFQGMAPYAPNDSALATAVWQTLFFVFYHEMGHAFIDVLDLPVTGREEDAVDQLATLVLLNGGDFGRDAALQGASWFWLNGQRHRRTPFWDEHSLDQQRYFNILCWVYGSNPQLHQALMTPQWGLPAERAQRCPAEYSRMSSAWESVLEEHQY